MKNVPSVIDGIEFAVNGCVKVSSNEIAEKFKKQHSSVMRSIRELEISDNFRENNFVSVEIIEENVGGAKRSKSYYDITEKGMIRLVMGFTGKESSEWKERFINAFEAMKQYIIEEENRRREKALATMHAPEMTEAIKEAKESEGKTVKPYHYSNEFDLINRIVLGVTAKKWREHMEMDKREDFRDALYPAQIEAVQNLQTANTVLIEMGMEFQARKKALDRLYIKKFAQKCLDEILKINA